MKNENKLTWKDVVKDALAKIGNSGHLDDINSQIEGHWKTKTNPTWKDTVRRTLQQYNIFYQEEKGSGIWFLKEEKPLEEFDPKKNPNPAHEDVQGMLLELGKIYGYETSAAINDAKKKFMNMPIEEVATIKEFQRDVFHPKIVDIVSRIDVLWFGGDTDMLVPEFAFEVEHTTDVTKGLGRLIDLHRSGHIFCSATFRKTSDIRKRYTPLVALRGYENMKKKETTTIEEKAIEIKGSVARHEIVKKVVNIFIDSESHQRGHGVKFRYPVEDLSIGKKLFIFRPAGLRKWNFDFKVDVLEEFGLGKGTHNEIKSDFQNKKRENPQKFNNLLEALTTIYNCSENDVDRLLEKYSDLQMIFQTGAKVDVLLKVVKWMFIMEDIVYWNYKGRAMLYNAIMEA